MADAPARAVGGSARPPRTGRRFARRLRSAVAILAIGLGLGGCMTRPHVTVPIQALAPGQRAGAERNLRVFDRVWDLVNRKHYEPKTHGVDWEKVGETYAPLAAEAPSEAALYSTLNEMLALLHDSHTHALTPAQAKVRRTQERARTGFAMIRIEDRWLVTDVMPGSPAALAGVTSGWIVVSRNGRPLGPRPHFWPRVGESDQWQFLDLHDRPVTRLLKTRELSTAPLQIEQTMTGGFVYLRFDEFDGRDRRWLSRELRRHLEAPGVIIDLRRNPGGETFSLGIMIGEFFDRAVDCGTFVTRAGARTVKNSWEFGSAHYHGRVVILVDAGTASAAEIFTAVLKDHRRAIVIGRKTAGAVLASWFYGLPYGGELQLSREDYIAPNGRRIEGNGIEPDIVVTRRISDLRMGRDADIEAALKILKSRTGEPE